LHGLLQLGSHVGLLPPKLARMRQTASLSPEITWSSLSNLSRHRYLQRQRSWRWPGSLAFCCPCGRSMICSWSGTACWHWQRHAAPVFCQVSKTIFWKTDRTGWGREWKLIAWAQGLRKGIGSMF
jgi:hypothetical protein